MQRNIPQDDLSASLSEMQLDTSRSRAVRPASAAPRFQSAPPPVVFKPTTATMVIDEFDLGEGIELGVESSFSLGSSSSSSMSGSASPASVVRSRPASAMPRHRVSLSVDSLYQQPVSRSLFFGNAGASSLHQSVNVHAKRPSLFDAPRGVLPPLHPRVAFQHHNRSASSVAVSSIQEVGVSSPQK